MECLFELEDVCGGQFFQGFQAEDAEEFRGGAVGDIGAFCSGAFDGHQLQSQQLSQGGLCRGFLDFLQILIKL